MNELQKHIDFAEKQFVVYRYHGHPDVLKMEALYKFLLSLKNNNYKTLTSASHNTLQADITIPVENTENKKEFGPQASLFDTSIFTKKNPHT